MTFLWLLNRGGKKSKMQIQMHVRFKSFVEYICLPAGNDSEYAMPEKTFKPIYCLL